MVIKITYSPGIQESCYLITIIKDYLYIDFIKNILNDGLPIIFLLNIYIYILIIIIIYTTL